MAKTLPPGVFELPNGLSITANVVPDPFDERDLLYRPILQPLPDVQDQRDQPGSRRVLEQVGNSCTGHAVAAVINTVLARITDAREAPAAANGQAQPGYPRVSPYMLYRLARRYDEFEGEEDEGSSLRGLFKGWFNHGVALEGDWDSLNMNPEPDLDDPAFVAKCRDRPLGAFYRVNPFRLDDMQSAISELHAIAASAAVHDGWVTPVQVQRGDESLHVIARSANPKGLGGHAFALVGYNEVGFLVQNSWGEGWGKGGYATLPYEDWLDTAYDAWVARPGVPQTPFFAGRTRSAKATGGELATGAGPDLKRLAAHVVNLANDGRLSTSGKFISTPMQIDRIFEHMARWHDFWGERQPAGKRHVVLYAHGGLVSEAGGLETAQKHLNWWLNNRVYPITFAWQSGPIETLVDQLVDAIKDRLPFGLGFDLAEQFDRLVEKVARANFRWMWDEMKENARAASKSLGASPVQWSPMPPEAQATMARMPGASLAMDRLARYIADHGAEKVAVHLVGHSAGAIFHAALLDRLVEQEIAVESMALLAPANRVDEFRSQILPHLRGGNIARFATFAMTDDRELDDTCGAGGVAIYQKSLLYLVSRALERSPDGATFEVPLLGMQRFFVQPVGTDGTTLADEIAAAGGACIFSRSAAPADSRSDSTSHGGFDDDSPTMTSVLMRVLGGTDSGLELDYQANAALRDTGPSPLGGAPQIPAPVDSRAGATGTRELRRASAAMPLSTGTNEPGEAPLQDIAPARTEQPSAPEQPSERTPIYEVADAPRSGSPIIDMLQATGWQISGPGIGAASPSVGAARSGNSNSPADRAGDGTAADAVEKGRP